MNWLKRMLLPLKKGLDKWLTEGEKESENAEEARELSPPVALPTAPIDRSPGIVCPQCSHKFPVTIELLLSLQAIYCPHCNLKLELNAEKSKEALEAMEKVWKETRKL